MKTIKSFLLYSLVFFIAIPALEAQESKVLIFSKTKGFRHKSIEYGREVIADLCSSNNIAVDSTEDAELFTFKNLKQYDALIFLNSTGDLFNEKQQNALIKYINNGGGFVGIHAATDAEYEWEWYGRMAGGYFKSHPKQQNAKIKVVSKDHGSTNMLPDEFVRWDEWYDFKSMNPDIIVLAKLDETSYEGGTMDNNHPIIWYHEFEGGRAFYTGFGHTNETFDEPLMQKHILGGILYAIGKE
jgi:type 1 glutamine amidotransferase